jgi:hemolysin activation/secretion protein
MYQALPGRVALICASFGLASVSQAQTPPVFDAGKALQETRPPQPVTPRKAPAEPVITQQEDKPLALPAGETLMVSAFRFEGADFIAESELQAVVKPFVGRALSMAEIDGAAARVTALVRERGYLVARAYVPRQDASGGTLTMRIVVGKFGKVTLKNQSLVRDGRVASFFDTLGGDRAVTRGELERTMLIVSDLPGAAMPKLSIAPGEAPGTADFDVEVGAGPRYGGYARLDNFGSHYTGVNRLSAGADFNAPFKLGDKLSFSGMSSETGGLLNGRVAYALPFGSKGLRGEIAFGRTTYQLGQAYADLDATGHADTGEATFTYPVWRGRDQNLTASLNLANRHMRDELRSVGDTTSKHANAATVAFSHERYGALFGLDGYTSLGGGFTMGYLSVGDAAHRASNEAGVDSVGRYGKLNLSASGRVALSERFSLSTSLTVQKALFNKNLDTSEQLTISGTSGVMAFEQAASGDNGYLLGVEARYALPRWGGVDHSVGTFFNHGYVALQNKGWVATPGRGTVEIGDVGLAYTISHSKFFARVQTSYAVGGWPAGLADDGRARTLLLAGVLF